MLTDGADTSEKMLEYMWEQTQGDNEFRKNFLLQQKQMTDTEREYRNIQLLLEHMSPQSKKTYIEDKVKRQDEQDLLNCLSPSSKKKIVLDTWGKRNLHWTPSRTYVFIFLHFFSICRLFCCAVYTSIFLLYIAVYFCIAIEC
jgi:hypothetical protein